MLLNLSSRIIFFSHSCSQIYFILNYVAGTQDVTLLRMELKRLECSAGSSFMGPISCLCSKSQEHTFFSKVVFIENYVIENLNCNWQ
jgi:hypothetical protein